MMNKILTMIFAGVFLFGCDASYKNQTEDFQLPEELKDCKVYMLRGENYSNQILVVSCLNRETTYQGNKKPTVTILQ